MVPTFKGPVFKGEGPGGDDTLCGKCGAVLIKNIPRGNIQNIVIKCFVCGSFNEVG
jgi:hypothetical protein